MTIRANSAARRDIAYHLHSYTTAKKHEVDGPLVITSGKGIFVYDDEGRDYLEVPDRLADHGDAKRSVATW